MGTGIQTMVIFELLLQEDPDFFYFCHDCDFCVCVQDTVRYLKKALGTWNAASEVTGLLKSLELSICVLELKFTTEVIPVTSWILHLIWLTGAQIAHLSGLAGSTSWRFDAVS